MKTKNYKPGQLLTLEGRVYRVKRKKRLHMDTCYLCDAYYACLRQWIETPLCYGTPTDCYLQLVVPKPSLG